MRTALVGFSCGLVVCLAGAGHAQSPPFVDPPFAGLCIVHEFGEGQAPDLNGFPDDPLCVEYQKRDITVDNGGAVRFLAAEPARFAIAVNKCRYWQQDHWRGQVTDPGSGTVFGWDGSYWFDKGNGTGAARLRNFSVGGQPAGPSDVASLVAPFNPDMAQTINQYGEGPGGGGGSSFCTGAFDPQCVRSNPKCGDSPCDAQAVANARAKADKQCNCSTAASNGAYTSCVSGVADSEASAGNLPAYCKGQVVRCAANSTCGRPGYVTCCRTNARGVTRCRPKRGTKRCRNPHLGTACASTKHSCCDACVGGSCAQ